MKRKVRKWACSNCGKPLKNKIVEYCPWCNAKFSIEKNKTNFKILFFVMPFALLSFYLMFNFLYTEFDDFSYRGMDSIEEFNIVMVFVSILIFSMFLILYFIQQKKLKNFEKKDGVPVNAIIELKSFEVALDIKLLTALIISFIIIFPVILIPAYIDITEEGVISSNTFLSVFLIILGVFVFILPFIVGYYAFQKPVKKLYEEEQ